MHSIVIKISCCLVIGLLSVIKLNAQQQPEKQGSSEVKETPDKVVREETVLGMNVTGTKELPNVLYIIPWKSNTTPLKPPQVSRLVDEIYAPVDPEVFSKQVKFYYQLTADKKSKQPNQ